MICPPCGYAADTNREGAHRMCESPASCSCQHHVTGYGRLDTKEPAPLSQDPPPPVPLDEWKKAALDSVGLTLNELRDKIQSWSADGQELLAWRVVNGEAA